MAGGRSSRMKRDKAIIEIDGVPLLRQMCEAALNCTDSVYVMTSWPERYESIVPLTIQFIIETNPEAPIVAFSQALAQISTEWILLLACDLPRLNGETLQHWANQLEYLPQTVMAFLPKHPKGWEPLCGFYRRSCATSLKDYLDRGERSFQAWLDGESVEELSVSDRRVLLNCNTPEDLAIILDSL